MFGPLGRPGLAPSRRPRRRTVLLLVLAALVVALVVAEVSYEVVRSGPASAQRDALSWDADAAAIAEQSSVLAAELHAIRGDARRIAASRLTFEQSLVTLEQATAAQRAALASIELPAPSGRPAVELETALSDRQAGARQLAAGVTAAIAAGGPGAAGGPSSAAVGALRAAALDFERADAASRLFVAGLPARVDPPPGAAARWITRPLAWSVPSLSRWVGILAAAPALRARHSVELVDVSVHPAPVRITGSPTTSSTTTTSTTTTSTTTLPGAATAGAAPRRTRRSAPATTTTVAAPTTTSQLPPAGSVSVLPPTAAISVVVVVRNDGNVADDGVVVRARLTPVAPGAASSGGGTVSLAVPPLAPGRARYLVLHPIPAGAGRYALVVTAGATAASSASARVVLDVGR
jgi:hypothetical protein